jgi:ribosomal protein S10
MTKIVLKSYESDALNFYKSYITKLLFPIKVESFSVPVTKEKITLLKSPHVHKKFKEHYSRKTNTVVMRVSSDKSKVIKKLSLFSINRNGLSIYIS